MWCRSHNIINYLQDDDCNMLLAKKMHVELLILASRDAATLHVQPAKFVTYYIVRVLRNICQCDMFFSEYQVCYITVKFGWTVSESKCRPPPSLLPLAAASQLMHVIAQNVRTLRPHIIASILSNKTHVGLMSTCLFSAV